MFKYVLFGIGFVFLFEGLVYFFFAKNIKTMIHLIGSFEDDKIKTFSVFLVLIGSCLIYFTIKYYEID